MTEGMEALAVRLERAAERIEQAAAPEKKETHLTPQNKEERDFYWAKYESYNKLVQFYLVFLITTNGLFFTVTGGIFSFILQSVDTLPKYFVFGLLIPLIISGSFVLLCLGALDGSKKLQDSVTELFEVLSMRTGPYVQLVGALLNILIVMHLVSFVFTLGVASDVWTHSTSWSAFEHHNVNRGAN